MKKETTPKQPRKTGNLSKDQVKRLLITKKKLKNS